jgi:hypothetical protein
MLLAAARAPTSVRSHDAPGCVFANPIVNGADPWVIRKGQRLLLHQLAQQPHLDCHITDAHRGDDGTADCRVVCP